VGRGITHQASQVFFGIPAYVVDQPVDFSGQLHITLNPYFGLVTSGQRCEHIQRALVGHGQAQVKPFETPPFEQACGRGQQLQLHFLPDQFDALAFLSGQALHGLRLAHEHMVEEQDQTVEGLVDHPDGRLQTCHGLRGPRKRGLCCHSPRLSSNCPGLPDQTGQ